MSQKKYNRMVKSNVSGKMEVQCTSILTADEAKTLNASSKHTGVKYVLATEVKKENTKK